MKRFILYFTRRLPQPIKSTINEIRGLIGNTLRQISNKAGTKLYPGVYLDPIIVHQMGKVGSKTVEKSLIESYKDMKLKVPIYHVHIVNVSDWAEKSLKEERANSNATIAVIH